MAYTDEVAAIDPLRRAKQADDRLWTATSGRIHIREERDEAVRDALRSGIAVEDVADALSIREEDVRRMAKDAVEHGAARAAAR